MTKIHPLAFGGKLNGAADAATSSRLRELQFLTPDDLNVGVNARDDAVLALAQVCPVGIIRLLLFLRDYIPGRRLPSENVQL